MGKRVTSVSRKQVKEEVVWGRWEIWMERFLEYKKAQGCASATITYYHDWISLFFRRYPRAWDSCTKLEEDLIKFLGEPGISPRTRNIRRNTLRPFCQWLVEKGVLEVNPLKDIRQVKEKPRIKVPDEESLRRLLELPDRNTYAGRRDYAIILLTLDTGIRPQEMRKLRIEDVDLRTRTVYINRDATKTVERVLPFTQITAEAIKELFAVRPPEWEGAPLFCSYDGRPLTKNAWRCRMRMYSKKLGDKYWGYSLRHAFALLYLRGGGDAYHLREIMGHARMDMTRHYVHLTQDDLVQQHRIASPVNRLLPPKIKLKRI